MRKTIFNHLKQCLETIPALKWIDLDTQQIDKPRENYPIPFPASLIEFNDINYRERTGRGQEVSINITINLWQERYSDAFIEKGKADIDALFDLIDAVGLAIHNSSADHAMTPFKRVSETTLAQQGNLFGYSLKFEALLLYQAPQQDAILRHVEFKKIKHDNVSS